MDLAEQQRRLLLAPVGVCAVAAVMTLLLGIEVSVRERIPLRCVGGYLSFPLWFFFVSLWGLLGGATAFLKGLAAGAAPVILFALLRPRDPWESVYYRPHPAGPLNYAISVLLPALPGGIGAQLLSGGHRGKA